MTGLFSKQVLFDPAGTDTSKILYAFTRIAVNVAAPLEDKDKISAAVVIAVNTSAPLNLIT